MSLLSKAEIQYLQGQKHFSKSYEYKLKSIIRKKVANLMSKDIPLLSSIFPNRDLTKFGKIFGEDKETDHTKISKAPKPATKPNARPKYVVGKFSPEVPNTKDLRCLNPKFYILNSINNQKENSSSSGGVEAIIKKAT